jgi:hypothetical protein
MIQIIVSRIKKCNLIIIIIKRFPLSLSLTRRCSLSIIALASCASEEMKSSENPLCSAEGNENCTHNNIVMMLRRSVFQASQLLDEESERVCEKRNEEETLQMEMVIK